MWIHQEDSHFWQEEQRNIQTNRQLHLVLYEVRQGKRVKRRAILVTQLPFACPYFVGGIGFRKGVLPARSADKEGARHQRCSDQRLCLAHWPNCRWRGRSANRYAHRPCRQYGESLRDEVFKE